MLFSHRLSQGRPRKQIFDATTGNGAKNRQLAIAKEKIRRQHDLHGKIEAGGHGWSSARGETFAFKPIRAQDRIYYGWYSMRDAHARDFPSSHYMVFYQFLLEILGKFRDLPRNKHCSGSMDIVLAYLSAASLMTNCRGGSQAQGLGYSPGITYKSYVEHWDINDNLINLIIFLYTVFCLVIFCRHVAREVNTVAGDSHAILSVNS